MADKLPQFVKMGKVALRLSKDDHGKPWYYRHAGMWGIHFRRDGERLLSSPKDWPHDNATDIELVPCTEAEWRADNIGYT